MCNLTMAMSVIQITNVAMYHCITSVKNATSDGWKIKQAFSGFTYKSRDGKQMCSASSLGALELPIVPA